nr:uncharacterized GPI-anchored protein At5g19250-like [Quercus suber]
MAILKLSLVLLVLHVVQLQGNAMSDCDAKKNLFDEINGNRMPLHLANFTENSNAACLANKIADQLKNVTCKNAFHYSSTPGTKPNITDFDKLLDDCDIKENHSVQGVILPVCEPEINLSLMTDNYTITTTSQYAKYLKDSNYTGIGIGSKDNWMVVVLSTNTSAGNFSHAASLIANFSMRNYLVALFIGFLVVSMS